MEVKKHSDNQISECKFLLHHSKNLRLGRKDESNA